MVGVTPYGDRSPRSASQHVAGIKKDTRAVKKVFRVKISQPHISYSMGIKNNTHAMKEAKDRSTS